jgi:hypothetical protein
VKRRPSTFAPPAQRSFTTARSLSEMCIPARRSRPMGNGSEGWLSTGATTAGSTMSESAKLPVKHMPMAPTPLPPSSLCTCRQSARSQSVTGLDWFEASTANSREMHVRAMTPSAWGRLSGLPGVPKSWGMNTVYPSATRRSANWMTCGVMPGISLMTTMPGPLPRR